MLPQLRDKYETYYHKTLNYDGKLKEIIEKTEGLEIKVETQGKSHREWVVLTNNVSAPTTKDTDSTPAKHTSTNSPGGNKKPAVAQGKCTGSELCNVIGKNGGSLALAQVRAKYKETYGKEMALDGDNIKQLAEQTEGVEIKEIFNEKYRREEYLILSSDTRGASRTPKETNDQIPMSINVPDARKDKKIKKKEKPVKNSSEGIVTFKQSLGGKFPSNAGLDDGVDLSIEMENMQLSDEGNKGPSSADTMASLLFMPKAAANGLLSSRGLSLFSRSSIDDHMEGALLGNLWPSDEGLLGTKFTSIRTIRSASSPSVYKGLGNRIQLPVYWRVASFPSSLVT